MDQAKLAHTPVLNLDAERSVGFVNYELKQRGAKELGTVSRAQVKGTRGGKSHIPEVVAVILNYCWTC